LTNLSEETWRSSRGRLLLLSILSLGHVIDSYSWKLAYFPFHSILQSQFLLPCSNVSNHCQVLVYQVLKNLKFAREIWKHWFFRHKWKTVYSAGRLEQEKNKEKLQILDGYCCASWMYQWICQKLREEGMHDGKHLSYTTLIWGEVSWIWECSWTWIALLSRCIFILVKW
jgi:hypothetical protein